MVKQYQRKDYILCIDSSKKLLKCILLQYGKQLASAPIIHSNTLKKYVFETKCYDQHLGFIYVDLQMAIFLEQSHVSPCTHTGIFNEPYIHNLIRDPEFEN